MDWLPERRGSGRIEQCLVIFRRGSWEALKKHFDERDIEITWLNAVGNYYNLLAVQLGLESDGLLDLALQRQREARS